MGAGSPQTDPVEPGYTTTEFWVTTVTGVAVATFGLLAAFGLNVSDSQRVAILTETGVVLPALAAVYAIVRTWRKRGA